MIEIYTEHEWDVKNYGKVTGNNHNATVAIIKKIETLSSSGYVYCTVGSIFLQTVHSKQANRALKRKELLKRKKREE